MKAISFADFGPANQVLKVSDWPTPAPGPGEVLVKLHTTGVNPSDVKKRAGGFPNLLDDGAVIPHSDGAGVIEGVGEWGAHFTDRRACFCLSSAVRALAWYGSRIRGDRYLTRT